MENGVGIVDGSQLGDKKGVDVEVLESRVEEISAVGSDGLKDSEGHEVLESRVEEISALGSDGLKDSEEDEVFEEAISAETPRVDSENAENEGGNGEKIGNLDTSLETGERSDVGHEKEKFEEAIGVLDNVGNNEEEPPVVGEEEGFVDGNNIEEHPVVGEEEGSVNGEPVDEVEAVGRIEQHSVLDRVLSNGMVVNGKDGVREVSEVGAAVEMEYARDGESVQKPENGVPINVDLDALIFHDSSGKEDANKQETQVLTESETRDTNEVEALEGNDTSSLQKVESNGEILHQIDKQETQVRTESQTRDTNKVEALEGGDISSQQKVESNGEILHEAEKNVEVNKTPDSLNTGYQDDETGDTGDVSAALYPENQSDKGEELKDKSVNLDTELKDEKSRELKEEVLYNVGPQLQDDKGEEQEDILGNLDVPDQDDRRPENDPHTSVEERKGILQEKEDNVGNLDESDQDDRRPEDDLHASVEERKITPHVGPTEDTTVEMVEKIQASTSDLGAENRNGSQLHHQDVSTEVSNTVAELKKEGAKDEDVKQTIPENRAQEIRPAAEGSSSTKKSTYPASTSARPAGLGRTAPLLEPAPRVVQQPRVNGTTSPMPNQLVEDPTNGEAEENDETREKLQMIRVKFLRLAYRLGQTPHNVVVAQVLYRLGLAEQLRGRSGSRVAAFSFDRASAMAEQLEAAGQEPLDFSCTIMVLGKTGVGKSATINSIFDEMKFGTDAFQMGTIKVQDVVGTVQGIKVRVIDTPGLLPSWSDQRHNEKILHSVKRFIKNTPPDIVLYLDRLDMQSRDLGDMPLLRTITEIFGPSIWFNAIVVLTHAASAPPEGPNGTATSYDMFVTQRSHIVQQAIRQAAGDMRLMNPVSLVENHSACRTNRAGQRVLPNGQVWKPHLLLLSFASKILAEANTLLKLQDSPPGKPFATRIRAPPLPFLLSSLLQSRPQVKLPSEQFGDDDDALDDDLDESSDSDDESEYDELPPFKRLSKAQLAKLTKAQKKAYYDELQYRETLFMKKQLKEEKRRRKIMKKMAASAKDLPSDYNENAEEESSGAASVPVPMTDLPLPASFDSDNPTHRYRCLDSLNQWLVRPVLENHGWDHDVGYEGINVERLFVVKEKIPVSFSGQISKDKKDNNLQMEITSSLKHGEGKATSVGFDVQTIGKDMAYTLRSDTRFSNYKKNKATAGLSVTLLGDVLTGGMKVEDKLIFNKRGQLVVSGGAIMGRGDVAYGGSLEATLRDKDHPLGRFLSTVGLSVMDWHGDLALGGNAQIQIPVGRFTNMIGRVNLNNRGSGQVSIRLNSSEHLEIALIALVPLLRKVHGYFQLAQFGQ